jgi:hypothetical protein
MGMQIDVAELAGIIIEGILYGMFVILTALSLYILLSRSRRGGAKVNKPMVVTSLLMFALATSQVIVDCIAMFDPFIKMTRPERIAEFKNNSLPINASKHGIFFTMMLLGDAIVVCWRKKLVSYPSLPVSHASSLLRRSTDVSSSGEGDGWLSYSPLYSPWPVEPSHT